MKKPLPLLILTLFLGGCAVPSTQLGQVPNDRSMGPDEVIIEVERIYEFGGSWSPFPVYDGDRLIGRVGAGGKLIWKRPSGNMQLHIKRPFKWYGMYQNAFKAVWIILNKQKHYKFKIDGDGFLTLDPRFPDFERFDMSKAKSVGAYLRDQSDCVRGDCVNGNGTYNFDNGARYTGDWVNGLMHGKGKLTTDEYSLTGGWDKEEPDVFAWGLSNDGRVGVREFDSGNPNGQGVVIHPDGLIESGYWESSNEGTILVEKRPLEDVIKYLKRKYADYEWPSDIEELNIGEVVVYSSKNISSGTIAIIDFEGNGITTTEVRALTDRLRSELVGTGQFTIIERGKMEEILKEQAFQQTGCVSSECAVEVGKLLSVENIIIGSISRVGSINSVTAKVVSVESGEIIRSTVYDHSGDIGGLLTQGMRKVAEELGK